VRNLLYAVALLFISVTIGLAQSKVTATQGVLSYTASVGVNCTVEVSTSASYSPLIKAVDSTVFTGANLDGQTNVGARQFRIAQRWTAQENVSPLSITVAGGNASRAPLVVRGSAVNLTYGNITITFNSHGFVAGDNIVVTGMGNSAYNTTRGRVMTVPDANHFTYFVPASATDTSGSGTITRANRYSLALQNNTTYFWRLGGVSNTCGASPATGSFTTMNWPNGDTWAENAPLDSSAVPTFPTIPESQAGSFGIIDPITGTLSKPLGLFSDDYGVTASPSGTGSHCSRQADGNGYFHCYIGGVGTSELYGINETTGAVVFLGRLQWTSGLGECTTTFLTPNITPVEGGVWDDSDPNTLYNICITAADHVDIFKVTYTGNDVPVAAPGTGQGVATSAFSILTPSSSSQSFDQLLSAFDASFNYTLYPGPNVHYENGGYLVLGMQRWVQGSPTWNIVFNLGDKNPIDGTCPRAGAGCPRITAAMTSWGAGLSATCGSTGPTYCTNLFPFRWSGIHGMGQFDGPTQGWAAFSGGYFLAPGTMGPFFVTLNQGGGINGTDATDTITVTSTITGSLGVTGDPSSTSVPPDGNSYLDQALPGDIIHWQDNGEISQVLVRNSATSLKIARGCHLDNSAIPYVLKCDGTGEAAHANGVQFYMSNLGILVPACCSFGWWNFPNDIHGHDQTQAFMVPNMAFGLSHWGGKYPYLAVTEGWNVKSATPWNQANIQAVGDYVLPNTNSFAGILPGCSGSACNMYPHYYPANSATQLWFWDSSAYSGGPGNEPASTVVSSGSGYVIEKYGFAVGDTFSRTLPYFSVSGVQQLVDISAPSSSLPLSSAGNYQYCVVNVAGECFSGSVVGEVYGNFPAATITCKISENGIISESDWCISNTFSGGHGIMQSGIVAANLIGTSAQGKPIYGASKSRKIVQALHMPHRWNSSAGNDELPDDAWVFHDTCIADPYIFAEMAAAAPNVTNNAYCLQEDYAYKIPGQPTADGLDRSNYLTVPIVVGSVGASPAYAILEYGYEENEPSHGTTYPPTVHYYCQQYQAACFWNGAAATPAYTAASGTHLSLSATSNLTIGVPQRTMAYNILYFNGSNVQVGSSGLQWLSTDPSAIGGPAIGFSPQPVTFGTVNIGSSSSPISVTVTNVGGQTLHLGAGAVSIAGVNPGDFSFSSDLCSSQNIAAAGTCTVSATFSPTASGTRAANLVITSVSDNISGSDAMSGTGQTVVTNPGSPKGWLP
jgi:hypothetical protein